MHDEAFFDLDRLPHSTHAAWIGLTMFATSGMRPFPGPPSYLPSYTLHDIRQYADNPMSRSVRKVVKRT
jgi:hypothetical protein